MIDFSIPDGPAFQLDPNSVLDIAGAIIAGVDIAPKRAIPDDGDPRIDHSLEGFLFTCGPDHIRHPEPIENEEGRFYPLHGSASANAAVIKSLETGAGGGECIAAIPVKTANGGEMLIERRWTLDAATGELALADTVINRCEHALPIMMMYHINFGAKHFDDGVRLESASLAEGALLESASLAEGALPWRFGEGDHGIFCVPAAAGDDGWSTVRLGPVAALGGRSFNLSFDTATLPHLQIWRNQEAPAHILGIEPASHRWTSRRKLAEAGELEPVAPGGSKRFSLKIRFD